MSRLKCFLGKKKVWPLPNEWVSTSSGLNPASSNHLTCLMNTCLQSPPLIHSSGQQNLPPEKIAPLGVRWERRGRWKRCLATWSAFFTLPIMNTCQQSPPVIHSIAMQAPPPGVWGEEEEVKETILPPVGLPLFPLWCNDGHFLSLSGGRLLASWLHSCVCHAWLAYNGRIYRSHGGK